MNKIGLILFGVIMGLGIVLGAWYFSDRSYAFKGVLIDPPAQAAEISLPDQHGNLFELSQQQGKVVLIFFGYTNCPDVCPISLSEFKKIKASLGDQADQVEFVFITVDPERDSRERMSLYLNSFDPEFIGLTAERQVLESIWKNYGVYQQRQESNSAAGYLVDHSARMYAIDAQGNWRLNYAFGTEIDNIVQDVKHLLQEG